MRVLFQEPELMILDEPTNHLDRSAKRWLLDELARFGGALLVVSHDLKLLDHAITKVLHIANQHLTEWKGNYSKFQAHARGRPVPARAGLRARAARDHPPQPAGRLHAGQHREAGAQGQGARPAGRAHRSRPAPRSTSASGPARSSCPTPPRSGAIPLEVAKLGVRYGSNEVLADVTFHAGRGDHIVIIGRNGAGKSSLLRCLAGVQEPTQRSGRARGTTWSSGYFAQEHEQIDPDLPRPDNVSDAVLEAERERRALLGSFGLPSKAADQLPATLSGGERAKLGLAMLSAGEANLLLLDEPTNNLDPSSIAAVGAMLGDWPGTIVAVSHERAFVEALRPTYLPAPARGALHPLARGVPRRRRDALSHDRGALTGSDRRPLRDSRSASATARPRRRRWPWRPAASSGWRSSAPWGWRRRPRCPGPATGTGCPRPDTG